MVWRCVSVKANEFGEESSFIVTFVRQLCNSRLQRYRRFLKGVPALNDKRSIEGVID